MLNKAVKIGIESNLPADMLLCDLKLLFVTVAYCNYVCTASENSSILRASPFGARGDGGKIAAE